MDFVNTCIRITRMAIKMFTVLIILMVVTGFLGCMPADSIPVPEAALPSRTHTQTQVSTNTQTIMPSKTPIPPTPTQSLTATPQPVGPDEFPLDINPLTGLTVQDQDTLLLPPALISISNSPVTTRPQAGLSYAAQVYELFIGIGASRFLAIFYGDLPPLETTDIVKGMITPIPMEIGPIRSGRLPYESLRLLYKGFLVFASASSRVLPFLDEYTIIYGEGAVTGDVNQAMVGVDDLRRMSAEYAPHLGIPRLSGLKFDSSAPFDGKPAKTLWLPYHFTDQVHWRYDPSNGNYQRWQDDGSGIHFERITDRLNQEPLAFENVIVMFADHHYYDEVYFDIDLLYLTRMPTLLFRNGKMLEGYWTTGNTDYEKKTGRLRPVRFVEYGGDPIPLKHGQTWVEIVPLFTPYHETVESLDWRSRWNTREDGSGHWAVYFQAPILEGSPTPSATPDLD
jgi:hypothetical protein